MEKATSVLNKEINHVVKIKSWFALLQKNVSNFDFSKDYYYNYKLQIL